MRVLNLLGLVSIAGAVETLVDLGYAKYQGARVGNGHVNQWLGMRFAAPSVPPLRFAAPQAPVQEAEVQDATKEGPLCVAANQPEGFLNDNPNRFMAEDCLFAAVFAPANATEQSNLPIVMFITGGGFSSNSNGNFNGSAVVEASGGSMIVVRANYRVGILGFIGGTMVDGDTNGAVPNNGFNDMIAAARWVKEHATKFGGNPDHIVLYGASSGGNAIDILLAANNGEGFPDLFAGAIAESTAWGSEGYSVDRDQALMNNLESTGCASAPDPIDCMRQMPIGDFQNKTAPDGWGPTIDGKLINAVHYQMYEQGRFQKNIPVIYGYASDEATPDFISNQTVNTTEEIAASIQKAVGASITDEEVNAMLAAYPESLNNISVFGRDVSPRANASLRRGPGAQWQRDAAIKTELKEICIGAFFSDMFAAAGQTANYAFRYNVLDETPGGNADQGLFSPHTSALYAFWGKNSTDGNDPGCLELDPSDPLSCATGARLTQAYLVSFIKTLNPNTLRAAGSPEWSPWSIAEPNRIVFDNTQANMEKMGESDGEVPIAGMKQRERCVSLSTNMAKRVNLGLREGQALPAFANGTRADPTLAVLSGNGTVAASVATNVTTTVNGTAVNGTAVNGTAPAAGGQVPPAGPGLSPETLAGLGAGVPTIQRGSLVSVPLVVMIAVFCMST
ncbi:alpha/beta-hydrolase [Corynespora cassiicola Philippines]|uniref:Carboxylic ester hydrolase n=1 Tax=Corynespora cassiicola Philippines TaxID=1448308 RepID=A0A2T2P6B8_CORCC|nr:alpha/beta-hydrolase [Corynespora cassiicola Philippines]